MTTCKWLPPLEICSDLANWKLYEDQIYEMFLNDFVNSQTFYIDDPVKIKKYPVIDGREEAFWHVTCQDYSHKHERSPDLRRCERIRWIRKLIENNDCNQEECIFCDGIKVWNEADNKNRIHILFENERYMVVLEPRNNYYLLITAFYFDQDHALRKKLNKYEKYKERLTNETPPKTPSTTGR